MTLLGNFDNNSALQLEDELGPKQEHLAGALAELGEVEPIVVRLPGDLGDVKICRDQQLVAETLQFLALERLLLQPETNSLNGIEKLTEPVMQLAGVRQGFLGVTRE